MAVPVIVIRILCGTGRGGGVEVDEHPRATTNDATTNDQQSHAGYGQHNPKGFLSGPRAQRC